MLAFPIILKLNEYNIPITKIPESKFDILIFTLSIPVSNPATKPPTKATMLAVIGTLLLLIIQQL